MQNDIMLLKKELIRRLEEFFGPDMRQVAHAKEVEKIAEQLLKEEQADPYVVIPAALLHNAGAKAAQKKYGATSPAHEEKEGPAAAGGILVEMGYEDANIYEICAIIAHLHTPRPLESETFRVVHDADLLASLNDKTLPFAGTPPVFLTRAGKDLSGKRSLE
jgi:hypothetical protein